MFKIVISLVAASVLAVGVAVPATANASTLTATQLRVNAILVANPGGTQIGADVITWDDGAVTLDLSPAAVGTCATGDFCAYSGTNLTGTRLTYASCSTYSISAFTVHSIANARSSGRVQGKNSAGTVLTTVAAGAEVGAAPSGVVTLRCVA